MNKREIIMKHYNNPINKKVSDGSYIKVNTRNESCIDNIDLFVKIEGNIIKDITFEGEACAISISSTSLMIENLIGKTVKDAKEYISNFDNMLSGNDFNKEILKDAIIYDDTKDTSRSICAKLPYEGIKKIIH